MSRKKILGLFAGVLGLAGVIASQFPGAGPAVGMALQQGGHLIELAGASLLDDCPPNVCGCDPKGDCAWHGPMVFPDAGFSCRCP